MATPFFRGNYGSALSQVDTRPILEAGRARGQMFEEVGGMIKEYGLNKQKRQVLTDSIEGTLNLYPEYAVQLTSSGDETSDKKNQTTLDKLAKGELGLSALEGLAGKLALMEKKDLKDQQEKIANQNARLLDVNIAGKEQALKTEKELAAIQKRDQVNKDKFLTSAKTTLNDLIAKKASGVPLKDFSGFEKFILSRSLQIRSGNIDPKDFIFDPKDALDLGILEQEYESLARKNVEEKKESVRPPEFISKDKAQEYALNLPEGFSAEIIPDKDGFAVKLKMSEKERVEAFTSIPGFPNYGVVGAYVYKKDPDKKEITKVGTEVIGQNADLLLKVIDKLETSDVQRYRAALAIGEVDEDDGEITFQSEKTGEMVSIPINSVLQKKIDEISNYQDMLKKVVPNLIDMRTR
tara:strand:+ start:43 stop:1266 length:1224 start_codon:yes stop_codon:yes gene_type:complete